MKLLIEQSFVLIRAVIALSSAILLIHCAARATPIAALLDFSDLGVSPGGIHMPAEYGGLRFQNSSWHYMSTPPGAASTNTYLALSGNATAILAVGGADFFFAGADIWSRRGADANGSFYFILYHDGVTVYDGREEKDGRLRFTAAAQHFAPPYTGPVDGVALVFNQGGDDWDHLAMDNFEFRAEPPAPRSLDLRIVQVPEGMRLESTAAPRQVCDIEVRTDLDSGDWSPLGRAIADNLGAVRFVDGDVAAGGNRFYRAVSR